MSEKRLSPLALGRILWRARRDLRALFPPELTEGAWTAARFGASRLITVNDAALARHILTDAAGAYAKGPLYQALLGDVLGAGSLLLEGETSRQRRRLIAPAFNARSMSRTEELVRAAVDEQAGAWAAQDGPLDLSADSARLTMRVALAAFFGADLGARAPGLARTLDALLTEASTPSFADLLELPAWFPRRDRGPVRRMLAEVDPILFDLIAGRRAAGPREPHDLLDMLLGARDAETGAALDDRAVRDEVMTLLLAGHETTALAIAFGLDRLAREGDWQDRIAADPALARPAFEEIMRLHPPAYVVARQALVHDAWRDLAIAPGDRIQIPIFRLHRDPAAWPEPERFDPGRFATPPPAAYMPFGAGPRACIGAALARLEGRVLLERMTPRLRFIPVGPPPAAVGRVTLRAARPILARVARRDRSA